MDLFAVLLLCLAVDTAPGLAQTGQAPPPAGPTSPAWYDSYWKAVADAELENWEGVALRIGEALKANPKSERNVRTYGMWHASYIPYYYLGLAQYNLGQPAEALKNLEKEEAGGVVQHDPVAYLKLRKTAAAIRRGATGGATSPSPPIQSGASSAGRPSGAAPAPAVGDNLVEGLQAFFGGDYDRSVSLFQNEMKRTSRDDLTLHLYLGMAYAGKATEDVKSQALWRNLAFLEFRRVRSLDPNYNLASGIFSEEMVRLFDEAQKAK